MEQERSLYSISAKEEINFWCHTWFCRKANKKINAGRNQDGSERGKSWHGMKRDDGAAKKFVNQVAESKAREYRAEGERVDEKRGKLQAEFPKFIFLGIITQNCSANMAHGS